jgi:O-methyltransferase
MLVNLLRSFKQRFGRSKVSIRLEESYPDIIEPEFRAALELCRPASMTSIERLYAVYIATRYAVASGVPGDLVECGVWKGGSVMMMASTLLGMGVSDRVIHLFDTYEGMTAPSEKDIDHAGNVMSKVGAENPGWLRAGIEEVRANVARTGYPLARLHFVKGDVLETIPVQAPERIALLRLDTDWYESTRHELEHLFPRLAPRGVLIIDDYGHYRGVRQAVDEYLACQKEKYFLQRVDYSARALIKA